MAFGEPAHLDGRVGLVRCLRTAAEAVAGTDGLREVVGVNEAAGLLEHVLKYVHTASWAAISASGCTALPMYPPQSIHLPLFRRWHRHIQNLRQKRTRTV